MDFPAYYLRQILLPEVGLEGQRRLAKSKCLIVGAGGLGSPVLLYLSAAGVGKLGICDGDILEESNLHRQPLYSFSDIGKSKAEAAAHRVRELNPFIEIVAHPVRLNAENGLSLVSSYDLVLDCSDNFQTKFLINDAAFLTKTPAIRASIYQFEGQIQTWVPARGDACLRCFWPEVPIEGCVGTCAEVGVLGPTPGYFGVLQALEALKFFLGLPTLQAHEILFADLMQYTHQRVTFARRPECPLCGNQPSIHQLYPHRLSRGSKSKFQADGGISTEEIDPIDLKTGSFELIDIREFEEVCRAPCAEKGVHHFPLSSFDPARLKPEVQYALFCQQGKRSAALVRSLREKGWVRVFSLRGGIEAFDRSFT